MTNKALNKKIDYSFSQYYSNCDFINKYNLVSFFKKPKLKALSLQLSLDAILNASITKSSVNNENNIKIVSFLFIYLIANVLPYISLNKIKLNTKNLYCLKIIVNNEQAICALLHDIHTILKFENIKNFDKPKFFSVSEICKANIFFELDSIINKAFKNIDAKDLTFWLRFLFVNLPFLKSSTKFVKNFPFLNN